MTTGRRIAALFLTLALAACGDENTYYDLAPTDPEKTGQDEAGIEADAGQPAPEEEEVSAPLFIRTPKLYASVVGGALYIYGDPEVIALSAATGGLLIERLRLWLPPCGNAGGYAAGKITLSVLDDTAARVYIKAIETQVMARDEIVEPFDVRLDLVLPDGWSLEVSHTVEDLTPGVAALLSVLAQGGELG